MSKPHEIVVVDMYCGAGGASAGLEEAARRQGVRVKLIAVNHWVTAINTHSANFSGAEHFCENTETLDPRKTVPGGRVDLLIAAPECTNHSNARGGRPINDQSRATAWHVLRWCEALHVSHVLIENVKEFRDWGPLDEHGRPIPSKKGRLYRQFLSTLRALGYTVSERIVNAADYGDATTRHRLFIQARKGAKRPVWPEPTHVKSDGLGLFPEARPWRPAREVIDWSLPGTSIYGRRKPLAPNTLARIHAGLRKFSGLPFLVPNFTERDGQAPRTHSVESPLPTVTGHGAGALVHPYLVVLRNHCDATPLDRPVPTLCTGNHVGLCEPFLVGAGGPQGAGEPRPITEPLGTVLGENHRALVEPFIVPVTHAGGPGRAYDVDAPLPTVTTAHRGEMALCQPFLTEYHGGPDGERRTRTVDAPMPTLDTSNRFGLARPFLVTYYGTGQPTSLDEPLDTITGKDRFALVSPELVAAGAVDKGEVVGWLDIRFRMLQPHELAAAMSFPAGYTFTGSRDEQVRQIGNAWAVRTATALCETVLREVIR